MIKMNGEQILSLASLDVAYPESIPFPDDGAADLGDVFHLAGCFRVYADVCNPTNNWAFLPPSDAITRAKWKVKDTLRRSGG